MENLRNIIHLLSIEAISKKKIIILLSSPIKFRYIARHSINFPILNGKLFPIINMFIIYIGAGRMKTEMGMYTVK